MSTGPALSKCLPGGGGSVPPNREYRSLLGEPLPGLDTRPLLALLTSALPTCAGVACGFAARYRAATPTTCGVAMDVPLIVFVAVLLVFHAEVMLLPGAKTSRQLP